MCVDVCADVCVHMYVDMCIDMCAGMCSVLGRFVLCVDMYVDTCCTDGLFMAAPGSPTRTLHARKFESRPATGATIDMSVTMPVARVLLLPCV